MKRSASSRKKPAEKPPESEDALQLRTAQWLDECMPNLLAFHVANERKGNFGTHLYFKRRGVKAGVADWLIFPRNGRKVAIELKNAEGEQRADQERFQAQWEAAGGVYLVARTLEEFQGIVNAVALF